MRVRIDASSAGRVAVELDLLSKQTSEALYAGMLEVETAVLQVVRANAPVFTGRLANSIIPTGPQLIATGGTVTIRDAITTSLPYAIVQEEGRAPNRRWPPLAPIRRWVELKVRRGQFQLKKRPGQSQADAIDEATFLVRRKIGVKGYKGKEFFKQGAALAERLLGAVVSRIAERMR